MSGTGRADDDEQETAGTRPDLLALGPVALTLPGGGTTRPVAQDAGAGPEATPRPPSPAPEQWDYVDLDSTGEHDSAPVPDTDRSGEVREAAAGVDPVDPVVQPDVVNADTDALPSRDVFAPDGGADRSPDRSVLTVLGAAVAAVLVLGGSVWFFTRPDTPAPPPQLHPVVLPTGDAQAPPSSVVTQDAPLPVIVDSECPGQTDPQLAASSDANSAWVCPTGGVPFGQRLVVTLPKPYVITGIKFWPGFQGQGADGGDEWYRHRLIKTAQVVFNDPDRTLVSLTPGGERRQYTKALNRVLASQAVITLQDTTAPPVAPAPNATATPPGGDMNGHTPLPDLGPLFSAPSPSGEDGPQGSSVAMWGLQVIGHLP